MQQTLAQLIEATESTNNALRSEAEAQLFNGKVQNPELFSLACSTEFCQKNLIDKVRPKAGILIKYTLVNPPTPTDAIWMSFSEENREKIKINILATLAYPDDIIRKVAADLIAIICSVEFPRGKWLDLIPALTVNAKSEDPEIKKSAILTLGRICDQFKSNKITPPSELVNQILGGIYLGMGKDERDDVKLIAISSLTESLIFARDIFANDEVRKTVVELLILSTGSNNKKIKVAAFRCFIEFVKIYYDYLREIYTYLWDATVNYITGQDKELAILAIEIWGTIANEEKDRSGSGSGRTNAYNQQTLGIIAEAESSLVPNLLTNLLEPSKYDDEDGGELNVASASKNCLMSISEVTKESFLLNYATKFIGKFLISNTPIELRAGLIAYTCMLDGPALQSLFDYVTQAIPTIVKILISSNIRILQIEAATALERTAELVPDCFFVDPLFGQIVPSLTNAIRSHPLISMHISKLWHHLGEEIMRKQNKEEQTFYFDFTDIINKLLENALSDLDKEFYIIIDYSLLAVMTLLLCTPKEDTKYKYIQALVIQFKNTANIQGDKKDSIQAGLLACLQTLLNKYHFPAPDELFEEIFNIIMDMFQYYQNVTADGLYVLAALASALGEPFRQISSKVWPFVAKGFEQANQHEIFLASLNAIVEITGACPEDAVNYLGDIFQRLLDLLQENDFDKNLKLRIIMSIGDIALGSKDFINNFVNPLNKMYQMAMNAAQQVPPPDSDMTEYLEQLRENVLDSYICYFHAVTDTPRKADILTTVQFVMGFLGNTCTREFNPSVDYVRSALAFIADVAREFPENARELINTDLAVNLIKVLENSSKNKSNQEILAYAKDALGYNS